METEGAVRGPGVAQVHDNGDLHHCWGRSNGGERSHQDTVLGEKRQGFLSIHLLMGIWILSISWLL